LLVVLPSSTEPTGDRLGALTVAGLPLARRVALAADRAGFRAVVRAGDDEPGPRESTPRRIVVLGGHVVPQRAWLRALLDKPLVPDTLYVDGGAVALIETDEPGRVLEAAARSRDADELAGALAGRVPVVSDPLEPWGRFALAGPADVAAAETWLLRSLIKPSEGFMSRHVERRISLAVTRRLVDTGITPNVMTLVSVGVGLIGAPFFLSQAAALQSIGALLFLAHSILDGCDGELARLKFLESRAGAMLDFWGDNLVHVAVFGCMAVGWGQATGGVGPLLLGALTIGSALATAALASRRFIGGEPSAESSRAGRLAEALSHRDFIYLIVALAAFGKAHWFVLLAAIGTPLFLLFLILASRARPPARRT
jgi:1L-myo-inositol 1-phosphate cytidylyltransferase / CDP-L-myo-inositol myo-inositolphosphotransferase